jgi:dienelactone hydrolase
VVFAHGSGSGRLSPRNQRVAERLQQARLATLLFDLLTPAEEVLDRETAHLRFDIGLLATRLVGVTDWIEGTVDLRALTIGYFGASTGAAAALVAAAQRPKRIRAVVSRGGRPDLAGQFLPQVKAATLLIVGGADATVLRLNQGAMAQMQLAHTELIIVPRATHLFEEPGALNQVALHASTWFDRYLSVAQAGLTVP